MDSEPKLEDLLYQTSIKIPSSENIINKIYVTNSKNSNPLIFNKGTSQTQYSKIKRFTFDRTNICQNPNTNPNLIGIEEKIHIPSQEFHESEKSISSYSFGFTNKLFKKTMTEIKQQNMLNYSPKHNKPLTPIPNHENSKLNQELNLMPNQDFKSKYISICSKYTDNYFQYALTIKRIYAQYLSVSNSNNEITRSLSFKHQTILNESNKELFKRDLNIYGNRKTLVLDLDETMVYATTAELKKFDFKAVLGANTKSEITIYVKLRPFLHEFLDQMSKMYEIVVLTASEKEYADLILDYIENNHKYFAHRLFKGHCIVKEEVYLFKNLNVLTSNRDISNIIIVDNSVRNFALFICNGIPIIEYYGSEEDIELCKLSNFLIDLNTHKDCSDLIKDNLVKFLIN